MFAHLLLVVLLGQGLGQVGHLLGQGLGKVGHIAHPVLRAETSSYVAIIDAGSGGSRIHVYYYEPRKLDAKQFPLIVGKPITLPKELVNFKTRPGISSYVGHTHDMADSLIPLFKSAADALLLYDSKQRLDEVPIYLAATAGMRVLPDNQIQEVMNAVYGVLEGPRNPFSFRNREQARVLSGEEEGVFEWLALNYKYGWITSKARRTYGSIGFGGGSVQIAFEPIHGPIMAGFFPLHINTYSEEGPMHLYSHSFLEFGFEYSLRRSISSLVRIADASRDGSRSVAHPCLPPGAIWETELEKPFLGNIRHSMLPSSDNTSREKEPVRKGKVVLRGTGDFEKCRQLASSLIHQGPCYQRPCSMLGIYQPHVEHNDFVLLGETAELGKWMVSALVKNEKVPILQALRDQLEVICSLPLQTQREMFGDISLVREPPCWRGTWILALLVDGLHFPLNSTKISVMPDCCDASSGQAIYEVNFFPYKVDKASYNVTLDSEVSFFGVGDQDENQKHAILVLQGAIGGAGCVVVLLWLFLRHQGATKAQSASGVPLLLP